MIEIPWELVIGALIVIFGLFFVIKSFKMPASFSINQQKREHLKKRFSNVQVTSTAQQKDPNHKEGSAG
jgi:hypothetical protein